MFDCNSILFGWIQTFSPENVLNEFSIIFFFSFKAYEFARGSDEMSSLKLGNAFALDIFYIKFFFKAFFNAVKFGTKRCFLNYFLMFSIFFKKNFFIKRWILSSPQSQRNFQPSSPGFLFSPIRINPPNVIAIKLLSKKRKKSHLKCNLFLKLAHAWCLTWLFSPIKCSIYLSAFLWEFWWHLIGI